MQGDKGQGLRPRRFTLEQRLLLFWLGSLFGAVLLVGLVFTYQIKSHMQDNARAKLEETLLHVRTGLTTYTLHLEDIANVLARQGELVALTQSIAMDDPFVAMDVAVQRVRLADELEERIGESHLDFIAALDIHGRLNAFVERPADEKSEEGTSSLPIVKGYRAGRGKDAVLFMKDRVDGEFHVLFGGRTFAERIVRLGMNFPNTSFYLSDGRYLYRAAARALVQRSIRGGSQPLGQIVVARRIDADFIERVTAHPGINFSYFIGSPAHNVGTLRAPSAVRGAFENIGAVADLFAQKMSHALASTGGYYLEGGKVSLLDGRRAYFFAGVSKGEVVQEIEAFSVASLETMALIALLVLPIGIYLLRRLITTPLALLRHGAQQITEGRYGALVNFRPGDELGDLARSFNVMSDSVRARENDLRVLSFELEDLVRERTRALELEMSERARAQAMLKTVIDNLADTIITTDCDGYILSVNPAGLEMFGYGETELLGQKVGILMPSQISARHDAYMRAYEGGVRSKIIGVGRQLEGRRKGGAMFPMEVAISEFTIDEKRYFTGILRDITQRRQAEQDLIDAKFRAEKASRAKSKLLSSVSHELRTPMNAIIGFGELLKLEGDNPLDEDQRAYVTQIVEAGSHLLHLIDGVLQLADMQNETMELVPQAVRALPIIEACLAGIAPEVDARRLSVQNDCKGRDLPDIFVDPGGFETVLENLLSNAARCTRPGGEVRVSCTFIENGENGKLRFSVRDMGGGLAEDSFEDLFHPRRRLDSGDDDEEGVRVGLVVAKKIATAMGCEIGFESVLDVGSVIWIDVDPVETDLVVTKETRP
ncbi:sensor histidine kinase [Varunaivibrio sulfuroxidans]|uniref:Sensor protein FixL n=1 Tax=Varunaivibrio sulfuroxidans TaxID=1773489 RepID=A0A4R3J8P5_9PROT|nr:PAS domain S-box protein [Varunaivibrio sulfuroxidans]TCS62218.1 PAS domain S-box-containing protein [Varunaivibrio sulfuroxidans]WES30643.1 PAS domain S-box protein [Varunaivibrio sulfuroxidans]